ncbi:nitrous oxide reductase accessory protein NosL [Longibacter salinarum]|nr:nitrous oxide reductase accessory protein NosL [Longibacter salinarum]
MMLRSLLFAALTALLLGCSPEPEPIRYGNDACSFCRMTIADARYGAELVTTTGKTYTFDSVECLAGFVNENTGPNKVDIHSLWVSDYKRPGTLINVDDAFFIQGGTLRSPMAMNVAAFSASASSPQTVADSTGGTVTKWDHLRTMVRERNADSSHTSGHHSMPTGHTGLRQMPFSGS